MCTVTIIRVTPSSPGDSSWLRIACNRDELRTRPLALPPETREFGRYQALLPIDPSSGGTWIATNQAGLTLALLNVNPRIRSAWRKSDSKSARIHLRSRGAIIPMLLTCGDVREAVSQAAELTARDFPPFRLVLADEWAVASIYSDGVTLRVEAPAEHSSTGAVLFTSSGLGDALVEPPRRALFDKMFAQGNELTRAQDEFHRHVWPDQPQLSVCMRRSEARTVSHTLVEVHPRRVWMRYHADAPDVSAVETELHLDRSGGA